jgi:thiol-disulfide isomerase/thioredoxin
LKRRAFTALNAVKALLLVFCIVLSTAAFAQDRHAEHALFMKKAPPLKTLNAIGKVPPLATPGKVVLLDFFAHYCGPCIAEFPHLQDLKRQYGEKLEVVGVARYLGYYENEKGLKPADELSRMEGFLAKHKVEWPVIVGPKDNFLNYKVSPIPCVVVIDGNGMVRGVFTGYSSEFPRRVRSLLDKILSAKGT